MTSSPPMCQYYFRKVFKPVRHTLPKAYVIYYMDEILLATSREKELQSIYDMTQDMLHKNGIIAPEKVQDQTLCNIRGN